MPDGRSIVFSKSARAKIPAEVIDQIRQRNSLDLALHARAEVILETNRKAWAEAGVLESLPPSPSEARGVRARRSAGFVIPKPEEDQGVQMLREIETMSLMRAIEMGGRNDGWDVGWRRTSSSFV
jgi:hypothetical protein